MTVTYWPVLGAPMDNARWGQLANQFALSGVIESVGGTGLQAFVSGGTGLFVRPGSAIVRGVFFNNSLNRQITIPQNTTTQPRNDRLVLRHNVAVSAEPQLIYKLGSATSTPTASTDPAGVYEISIARTVVPAGGVVPSTVADERDYIGLDVVPTSSTTLVPAARRRTGTIASGAWGAAIWSGTAWKTLSTHADVTLLSYLTGYGAYAQGGSDDLTRYTITGGEARLYGMIRRTGATFSRTATGTTAPRSQFDVTPPLPAELRPTGDRVLGMIATRLGAAELVYDSTDFRLYVRYFSSVTIVQTDWWCSLNSISFLTV